MVSTSQDHCEVFQEWIQVDAGTLPGTEWLFYVGCCNLSVGGTHRDCSTCSCFDLKLDNNSTIWMDEERKGSHEEREG